MGKPNSYRVPKVRTTVALKGSTKHVEVRLDAASALAIDYARRWLRSGPGGLDLDVLASGVVRRSLEVYMQHLSNPVIDPSEEARAVVRRCDPVRMDQEHQEAALQCLHSHDSGVPLPPWPDLFRTQGGATGAEELTRRADVLASEILAQKGMRLRLAQKRNTNPKEG